MARRWSLVLRLVVAAGAGLLLYVSFPPRTLWWLAPLAFALLGVVLHGRRARAGFGYGYVAALGFFLPLLSWTGVYVGPGPWLALCALEALFVAAAAAGIAVVSRLPGAPVWAACLWVAGEALRARVPFGGFPWGKLAFGQPDGPYQPLAAVGGTPLVGFAVTLTGFGLPWLVLRLRAGRPRRVHTLAGPVLAVLLPVIAGLATTPLVGTGAEAGTATVALIQGNVPRLGLDFNAQREAVLNNHVRRTEQLAADVRAGHLPQPDFVIWPENSSDVDPYRNADAYAAISQAVRAIGVPTAVGAVVVPDTGGLHNSIIQWDPLRGPVAEYVKRRIQPFGEYIPLRSIVRLFSPYVDRVQQDFVPGTQPGVLSMGPAKVGLATCYEVAFDGTVRDTVLHGAQVLAVPTNNATFGLTDMTYQQLAMSRERAVENGRAVLIAATSGVSAVVAPDGSVTQQTQRFTAAALVAKVPLRSTITLATRLGAADEWALVAVGLLALAVAVAPGVRRRRAGREPRSGERSRWLRSRQG
jgi:apolipoprotein N-acyltransferase